MKILQRGPLKYVIRCRTIIFFWIRSECSRWPKNAFTLSEIKLVNFLQFKIFVELYLEMKGACRLPDENENPTVSIRSSINPCILH